MSSKNIFKVATTQYSIGALADFSAYQGKLTALIRQMKAEGADFVLLPEYAGLELASWNQGPLEQQFNAIQALLPDYLKLFQQLAQEHQLYIQPGSLPVRDQTALFRNRAYFFCPDGRYHYQDKIQLTPFEQVSGLIESGDVLQVFHTPLGKIAIAICYDSEFSWLAERWTQAGVTLLLVPSCTETRAGFHRVHISSRARALENQCYVAQASLVGQVSGCDFVDQSVGQAGIFSPIDLGFVDDGVMALGAYNEPGWVMAECQISKLETVRKRGQVRNFQDQQALKIKQNNLVIKTL